MQRLQTLQIYGITIPKRTVHRNVRMKSYAIDTREAYFYLGGEQKRKINTLQVVGYNQARRTDR